MGCFFSCFRNEVLDEHFGPNYSVYDMLSSPGEGSPIILPEAGISMTSPSSSSSDNSLPGIYQSLSRPLAYDAQPQDPYPLQDRLVPRCWKESSHSHQGAEPLRSNVDADTVSVSDGGKFNLSAGDGETRQKLYNSSLGLSWVKALTRYEGLCRSSEEEDVCPTCLEEYTSENPRILTKCSHHFHLGCIYEWLERSETCPVCDKVMEFDETS